MWRHQKYCFTDNTPSAIAKIAVEYSFREAVLEIKVYFCPLEERVINIEVLLGGRDLAWGPGRFFTI